MQENDCCMYLIHCFKANLNIHTFSAICVLYEHTFLLYTVTTGVLIVCIYIHRYRGNAEVLNSITGV